MGGWKVVCLSGGPWLPDLRDCLDLYKGSQGLWEIQISYGFNDGHCVPEASSSLAAWQVPASPG